MTNILESRKRRISKRKRYRVVVEFDTDAPDYEFAKSVAHNISDAAVTRDSNPVFLSLEEVE